MKDWIPKGTFSNISEKIEPIHVYGVFAAGFLALIEIFAPEIISRYLKAAVLISFVLVLIKLVLQRAEVLPDIKEADLSRKYKIDIPCTMFDLNEAIKIASYHFKNYTIKPEVVRRNRELNQYSFVIVRDNNDRVLGFIDLFYLRPDILKALVKGSIAEPNLLPEHIISSTQTNDLYLAGFAVAPDVPKFEKVKLAHSLVYAMLQMISKRANNGADPVGLYTIGYSRPGRRWIEGIGAFAKIEDTELESDTPPYKAVIDSATLDRLLDKYVIAKIFTRIKFSA
jgi:hypothetical protein